MTLLERYMGVSYYAYKAYTLTPSANIELPEIEMSDKPAFRFRQTHSYGCQDPDFERWFRLENSQDEFAGNLWVHTFNRILPSSVYGEKHPEYYSFINGKRRPGSHSQWCLSNPEVYELAVQKIDSIFKANPGMKMISVSQNDGNNTQCHCEACAKIEEYEGAPSGNLIRFVNKLAKRFPDKQFSTLAYLYSMHPPKHVKPLPNVNIMLCDIDCKREVPLTDNESGRDFMRALEGWSKISNNIFVWDYGINFDNMVAPFPNFHIIQKNIQLFKEHHATMIFEQINGGRQRGTDFGEMRAYMIAKLMWDPYQNADSLMRTFMKGYYGAAAPYIYKYQMMLTGALLSSSTPLWIYDSPISHKNGMLNDRLMKVYAEIFDQAEAAVAGDSTLLARVQTARLPLRYSELEITRTKNGQDAEATSRKLEIFREQCAKYGITASTSATTATTTTATSTRSASCPRHQQGFRRQGDMAQRSRQGLPAHRRQGPDRRTLWRHYLCGKLGRMGRPRRRLRARHGRGQDLQHRHHRLPAAAGRMGIAAQEHQLLVLDGQQDLYRHGPHRLCRRQRHTGQVYPRHRDRRPARNRPLCARQD